MIRRESAELDLLFLQRRRIRSPEYHEPGMIRRESAELKDRKQIASVYFQEKDAEEPAETGAAD